MSGGLPEGGRSREGCRHHRLRRSGILGLALSMGGGVDASNRASRRDSLKSVCLSSLKVLQAFFGRASINTTGMKGSSTESGRAVLEIYWASQLY